MVQTFRRSRRNQRRTPVLSVYPYRLRTCRQQEHDGSDEDHLAQHGSILAQNEPPMDVRERGPDEAAVSYPSDQTSHRAPSLGCSCRHPWLTIVLGVVALVLLLDLLLR